MQVFAAHAEAESGEGHVGALELEEYTLDFVESLVTDFTYLVKVHHDFSSPPVKGLIQHDGGRGP